jgi:hypothetical protein
MKQFAQQSSNGDTHQRNVNCPDYITDYQNFLRDAPIVEYNLKPFSSGNVIFKHEKLSAYSTVTIIVVDDASVIQSTKSL